MPIVTFLSCIGSPTSSVDAVTFLARWLGLPDQTTPLYVSLMTLTRYGQVIASASGFAFLSFGVVLAYYGKIRIRWSRLLSSLAAALIVAGGFVWAARSFDRRVLKRESNPYLSFQLDPDVTRGVNVSLAALDSAEPLPQGYGLKLQGEREKAAKMLDGRRQDLDQLGNESGHLSMFGPTGAAPPEGIEGRNNLPRFREGGGELRSSAQRRP